MVSPGPRATPGPRPASAPATPTEVTGAAPPALIFRFLGATLASDLDLPELPRASGAPVADWSFRCRSAAGLRHEPPTDSDFFAHTATGEGGGVAHFPHATFRWNGHGRIEGTTADGGSDADLRHLLLDHLLPRIIGERGRLIVHASAVAGPSGAVVFLGESHAGKSSMAAALGLRGWPVLTDDAAALDLDGDSLTVRGTYPTLRLWPATLDLAGLGTGAGVATAPAGKRRLGPADGIALTDEALPLRAVVVLGGRGAVPATAPLAPRAVVEHLHASRFVLDPTTAALRPSFDAAVAASGAVALELRPGPLAATAALVQELLG